MPLNLIVGPPNSGRVREVVRGLEDAIDREPALVVPTGDEVARFERELCAGDRAMLGVSITTFGWLFDDLARELGATVPPPLSAPERLALIRVAAGATRLRVLGRSTTLPGFAPALAALIDELQGALVDPATLRSTASAVEDPRQELDLADLYEAYVEFRGRAGRGDRGQLAELVLAELRRDQTAWAERPTFVYGFDDLTRAQLELIAELSRTAEVTVAVNYEDRIALSARAALLGELREALGAGDEIVLGHEAYTTKPTLRHLDGSLFEADAAKVEPDDGLVLLECGGERGEAEAIALEAARLIAEGVAPDEIAVVLRHPAAGGPLLAAVLAEMGVPAALEAGLPLEATGVGRSLVSLCRAASDSGTPADLLTHLRADPTVAPSITDEVELKMRRRRVTTIDEAIESWATPPRHLASVRGAGGPAARLRALARAARGIAEGAHRRGAPLADRAGRAVDASTPLVALELRAGVAAAELLEELATVGELPGCDHPGLDDAIVAIQGASIPAWRGPAEGRVRILSPYRARGTRVRFLFCASLQEGEFPGPAAPDPLLGEERRRALGIAALRRQDPTEEERYLFHACVSRPVERLYLSWQSSDDAGSALARSPFVDEVLDLIAPDSEGAEEALKRHRGLERVVPTPAEAPTERQLARGLALAGRDADHRAALASLGVAEAAATRVLALLERIPDPRALPGPLRADLVLAALGSRELLSANALEQWLECPYRWFVQHELTPERLEAESDPLWLGGVVHAALERLYRERPGSDSIPRPGDLERWQRRFGELLVEEADGDAPPPTGERAAALHRARVQVEGFLEAEARSETQLRPDPELLEWSFGFEAEGSAAPLRLGELALRGRVDRVDLTPDGRAAVVRDYKTSSKVTGAGGFDKDGALQVQLYIRAVRDLLALEPIAGLYQPLGATGDRRPRGIAIRDERLGELDLVSGGGSRDVCDAEEFEEVIDAAVGRARTAAAEMRSGEIDRRPLNGRCPTYCTFQSICRLERALGAGAEESGERDA